MVALKRAKERYLNRKTFRTTPPSSRSGGSGRRKSSPRRFISRRCHRELHRRHRRWGSGRQGDHLQQEHGRDALLHAGRSGGRMRLEDFFSPGSTRSFRAPWLRRCLEQGSTSLYETFLAAKNGGKIPCQLLASVLFEEGEEWALSFFSGSAHHPQADSGVCRPGPDAPPGQDDQPRKACGQRRPRNQQSPVGILNYARLMMKMLGRGPHPGVHRQVRKLPLSHGKRAQPLFEIVSNLLSFSRNPSWNSAK